jgi:hypothetical protein
VPPTHQLGLTSGNGRAREERSGDLAIISRIDPDAAPTSVVQLAQTVPRSLLISSIVIV